MHPTHNPTVTGTTLLLAAADDITLNPTDVTPAQILRRAARYLELNGWHQGALYAGTSTTPAACAIGAIGMTACGGRLAPTNPRGGRLSYRAATNALHDYLHSINGEDRSIGDWNDTPGRTAAEVIAALNAAAYRYERHHTTGGAR